MSRSKSSQVCVVGNLNADLVFYPLKGFPAWGAEVIVPAMDYRPGGIGNALLCLAGLSIRATALANVGADPIGEGLVSALEDAGVDTRHVERSPGAHTGVSVGLGREDGERAFVTHLGHLALLDVDLALRQRAAWREAQYVLISGYFLLPGLGFEGTRTLIDEIHADGKQALLDTGWDINGWPDRSAREVMRLLEGVDAFLPSLNEAQALTGECAPEACLEKLFARCPNRVIIKLGEEGSIAKTEEGVFRQPAFPVSSLDTTGAGDSFNAGVIFGLLQGWDIRQTLRFANALAGLVISRPRDEGYPALDEVKEYTHANRMA